MQLYAGSVYMKIIAIKTPRCDLNVDRSVTLQSVQLTKCRLVVKCYWVLHRSLLQTQYISWNQVFVFCVSIVFNCSLNIVVLLKRRYINVQYE